MPSNPILIVEDEHDLRETMKDLLELEGYQTVTAGNGQEGLAQLQEMAGCSLILLDLMMPVMNGWEFLNALRHQERHCFGDIPVVVVSAAANAIQEESRIGCTVMKKPVDFARLLALVERHCRGGE
jgi:CheY-like chemotaxis protein